MTSIVGVLCTDGVVLGTDSSATLSSGQVVTIEQPTEKLDLIEDRIIAAGTGAVGLGQRFCAVLKAAWNPKLFVKPPVEVGKGLARAMIEDMSFTHLNRGQYGALVAFPVGQTFHLCEFATNDFQPELKTERFWYCSMGSAQYITDPFLALMREVFWQSGPPTLSEAVFAVTWTLEHAVTVNPGGVNRPVRIGVLEHVEKGELRARILEDNDLEEHRQHIDEAKKGLRRFREDQRPTAAANIRNIPQP